MRNSKYRNSTTQKSQTDTVFKNGISNHIKQRFLEKTFKKQLRDMYKIIPFH